MKSWCHLADVQKTFKFLRSQHPLKKKKRKERIDGFLAALYKDNWHTAPLKPSYHVDSLLATQLKGQV